MAECFIIPAIEKYIYDTFTYISIQYNSNYGYKNHYFMKWNLEDWDYGFINQIQGTCINKKTFSVNCSGGTWKFISNIAGYWRIYKKSNKIGTVVYTKPGETIMDYTNYSEAPWAIYLGRTINDYHSTFVCLYDIYYDNSNYTTRWISYSDGNWYITFDESIDNNFISAGNNGGYWNPRPKFNGYWAYGQGSSITTENTYIAANTNLYSSKIVWYNNPWGICIKK